MQEETGELERLARRSPELMERDESVVVVVDMQAKLLPLVLDVERLAANARRILEGAKILNIPMLFSEQYPQRLGETIPELREFASGANWENLVEKMSFSCMGSARFVSRMGELKRNRVLLMGIETHVCILQTALDLLSAGFRVSLLVDGVSARNEMDHVTALRRLESQGVVLTTTETAIFEWCVEAGTDRFRQLRQLI